MQEEVRGRWIYIPYHEEVPVTFQIGMVGSDGVLLASDRLHTQFSPYRNRFLSDKISVHEDIGLAYCCTGDDLTTIVMQHVLGSVRADRKWPIELHLSTGVDRALEGLASRSKQGVLERPLRRGSVLAVYRASRAVQLWKFDIDVELSKQLPAYLIENHCCIGDDVNAASFFVERYFDNNHKVPLAHLAQLAAHTVLMAGATNPTGVDGLDIVLCTQEGFTPIDEKELSCLKQQSAELNSHISAVLLG